MNKYEVATLAGGCFWCTEAIYERLKGVVSVVPGYAGGNIPNPTYEQVATGLTGHAETIQITFDPKTVSFEKILDIFWHLHDPTTPNRQGADVGTQYRSVVFYHDEKQRKTAERVKEKIEKQKVLSGPIVTQIIPFTDLYKAENYHQQYYDNNKNAPYCMLVIDPKVHKLLNEYKSEVRGE